MTRDGVRRTAMAAETRAFQELYEHLREYHGISPAALARARTVADLEAVHDDYGDEGCIR